ncbi:nucleotidyltransferase family protein [Geomobilimonas luticola]|uniref:Nucleotidyltransferase domain-containing protein n=1 Tax=Geomobilimonas luticola TaxID=1114878 RepID=A0ABS5S7T0_9BACT|nr:nucleotidyltransferase domain-containing protein [Geomobilimonas luticola]MBT0651428.1 nucleotidyltransferase domain-containing protein [Geomobilimonas luticola]
MAKRLPKKIEKALAETKSRLHAIYAQRLKDIILFGSYARGDYTKGSDIDLLVLLDRVSDPEAERDQYLPVVHDLSLKYDTVVSVIPMDYEMYGSKKTPLILNAHREGVRI